MKNTEEIRRRCHLFDFFRKSGRCFKRFRLIRSIDDFVIVYDETLIPISRH